MYESTNWEDAIGWFKICLEIIQDYSDAWYQLACILCDKSDYNGALECY